jgi:hypothetical protein
MNITSGPRAFEVFFEQFLYAMGSDFVDTSKCVKYDHESDEITEYLRYLNLAISQKNEERVRQNIIRINQILLK